MQDISPYDGLDASLEGIQEDQKHEDGRYNPERHRAGWQECVQHQHYHEDPDGCSQHAGNHEHRCTGPVGGKSESFFQVGIYGCYIHFVIQGQQYPGNDNITQDKSQHQGHVEKILVHNVPRYGNERNPAYGGAYHSVSDYGPGRFFIAQKIGIAVGFT